MCTRLITLLFGLLSFACGPRPIEPAEAAVQSALAALYRNDVDGLLGLVSAATRDHLKNQLNGKAPRDALTVQLDWRFERPVFGRPRLVSADPESERRSVEFMLGNVKSVVPVVRESGAWKVHLLDVRPVIEDRKAGGAP